MLAVAAVVETLGRLAVLVEVEQQGHLGPPHKQELLELLIRAVEVEVVVTIVALLLLL